MKSIGAQIGRASGSNVRTLSLVSGIQPRQPHDAYTGETNIRKRAPNPNTHFLIHSIDRIVIDSGHFNRYTYVLRKRLVKRANDTYN